jgi:hypothetical protein
MISIKVTRVIFLAICFMLLTVAAPAAFCQDSNQPSRRQDEGTFDLELYVIAASNQQPREGKIPASLEPVIRQLRETLSFKNYSLETTLLNRVKNGGQLSLNWIVGQPSTPSSSPTSTPIFNEFSIGQVRQVDGNEGQAIQMLRFHFGSRVPIQTGTNLAASGTNAAPVFVYEPVGLAADLSVREGQPAVVGTLNVGPSGEAIVLAICAKRVRN